MLAVHWPQLPENVPQISSVTPQGFPSFSNSWWAAEPYLLPYIGYPCVYGYNTSSATLLTFLNSLLSVPNPSNEGSHALYTCCFIALQQLNWHYWFMPIIQEERAETSALIGQ